MAANDRSRSDLKSGRAGAVRGPCSPPARPSSDPQTTGQAEVGGRSTCRRRGAPARARLTGGRAETLRPLAGAAQGQPTRARDALPGVQEGRVSLAREPSDEALSAPAHAIDFPAYFVDEAPLIEAKGWFADARVRWEGRVHRPVCSDPVRLAQEVADELAGSDPYFSEANLVVVERVTRPTTEAAVAAIASRRFAEWIPESWLQQELNRELSARTKACSVSCSSRGVLSPVGFTDR